MTDYYVYDIEAYPNVFTLAAKHHATGERYAFEISEYRNDHTQLLEWMRWLHDHNSTMVGFNSISFDYPVLHYICKGANTPTLIYQKVQLQIKSANGPGFPNTVRQSEWLVRQLDLFKIHHFDNQAKMTSLKQLEFAMGMWSIQDLPYPVGQSLTREQIKHLHEYNAHDVDATDEFLASSLDAIKLRSDLSEKYQRDFSNHNDPKIGKEFFVMRLEESGIPCYNGKKPRQTERPHGIPLSDIILPFISFNRPEFTFVSNWLKNHIVHDTREALLVDSPETRTIDEIVSQDGVNKTQAKAKLKPTPLAAVIDGFSFDFGLGGLHGSVSSRLVESTETHMVVDLDVTSYYPSISIEHRLFPQHLSDKFCDVYAEVKKERLSYADGTAENVVMKLALNGTYGSSNSPFSPFYDPQFTMSITVNGQLMLAMLSERLIAMGVEMIQANTDGVTVKVARSDVPMLDAICKEWETLTKMQLKQVEYSRMWIRDVNNYIVETTSGKIKSKGAYALPDGQWHKNHSALVVPIVALKHLQTGVSICELVVNHTNMMDFLLLAKVRRCDALMWGDEEVQRLSRYYVTTDGRQLAKAMPVTEKQRESLKSTIAKLEAKRDKHILLKPLVTPNTEELEAKQQTLATGRRMTSICAGYNVRVCNDMTGAVSPINYEYYINEVKKLTDPVTSP